MWVQRIILENHSDISVFGSYIIHPLTINRKIPSEISSKPAIIRKVVDFPQPDGPTNTINSLSLISKSKSVTEYVSALSYFYEYVSSLVLSYVFTHFFSIKNAAAVLLLMPDIHKFPRCLLISGEQGIDRALVLQRNYSTVL